MTLLDLLAWAGLATLAGLLGLLLWAGGRRKQAPPAANPPTWPKAAIIIPVAGPEPHLAESLSSLLDQDYPEYDLVVVLESQSDPAWPEAQALLTDRPRARLILAGPTQSGGQKNTNLLAGLAGLNSRVEVVVFADAGRRAEPGWLKGLIRPLADPALAVVSGYHYLAPDPPGRPGLSQALAVLFLGLTRRWDRFRQPWGGALALRRTALERLDLVGLWSRTVVDDVTLAPRLKAAGLAVGRPDGPDLETLGVASTWTALADWMTRQAAFLKATQPGNFALLGLAGWSLTLGLAYAAWSLLAWPTGPALLALAWLGIMHAFLLVMARLNPRPLPAGRLLLVFPAALSLACLAYHRALVSPWIHWRRRSYRVGRGGVVREIRDRS